MTGIRIEYIIEAENTKQEDIVKETRVDFIYKDWRAVKSPIPDFDQPAWAISVMALKVSPPWTTTNVPWVPTCSFLSQDSICQTYQSKTDKMGKASTASNRTTVISAWQVDIPTH